jgi:hypothetical protein
MSAHGQSIIFGEIVAPRSPFYNGPFGRMFRNLPPQEPKGETDAEKQYVLEKLAERLFEYAGDAHEANLDNPGIPSGYTYFGQFIDHDITFDPTSSLQRLNDPNRLRNFRTPRLDLDNLYGAGPDSSPYIYDQDKPGRLVVGPLKKRVKVKNNGSEKIIWVIDVESSEEDLPRNDQGRALIGDPRNDENFIVSQLQLALIKFHNKVMDYVEQERHLTGTAAFEEARRLVRWHYQWVVLHDFLKRIVDPELVDELLPKKGHPGKANLCFYGWENQPFMPVEFSVAAYRLGHTMIRPSYSLNFRLQNIPIFVPQTITGELSDLRGFHPRPRLATIQWDLFLNIDGSDPQKSRRIDTRLSPGLKALPGLDPASLAFRNLMRGWRMQLPSGQAVAKAMGIRPLDDGNDPLWLYILQEAAETQDGKKLGPVGARIVAEVFVGLLVGDNLSFLNIEPDWKPEFDREGREFELRDILRFADVPLTEDDLNQKMF